MSSIRSHGFLADEVDIYRARYRNTYDKAFAACEEKSNVATARLFNADLSAFDTQEKLHIVSGIGLWCRCLRACQGAILLVQRGMVPEAQALVRTAYEFLFYAVAVVNDPGVMESMELGDSYARKEQARAMLHAGVKVAALTADQITELNTVIAEHTTNKKQVSVYDVAEKAGMEYLHATVYRGMSFIAAHATLAATNSVFEPQGDGFTPVFGPSDEGLEFCIGLIDLCLTEGEKRFGALLQPA